MFSFCRIVAFSDWGINPDFFPRIYYAKPTSLFLSQRWLLKVVSIPNCRISARIGLVSRPYNQEEVVLNLARCIRLEHFNVNQLFCDGVWICKTGYGLTFKRETLLEWWQLTKSKRLGWASLEANWIVNAVTHVIAATRGMAGCLTIAHSIGFWAVKWGLF